MNEKQIKKQWKKQCLDCIYFEKDNDYYCRYFKLYKIKCFCDCEKRILKEATDGTK